MTTAVSEETVRRLVMLKAGRAPVFTAGGPTSVSTKPPASSSEMTTLEAPKLTGLALIVALEFLLQEAATYRTGRVGLTYVAATTYRVTVDGNNHDVVATVDAETTVDAIVTDINAGRTGSGPETEYGRSKVTIGTWDAATTYTVTLDAVAYDSLGQASESAAIDDLADKINSGDASDKFTASNVGDELVIDNKTAKSYTVDWSVSGGTGTISAVILPATAVKEGSGDTAKVLITGTSVDQYTLAVDITAGTGTITLVADATSVKYVLWGVHLGRTVPVIVQAETTITTNARLLLENAGLEYLAVQITDTDGQVSWAIGPADQE